MATDDELIVDLFAGGGGASEAILVATGRHPDIAVNHDREAVALHAANHPTTRHFCEDIARVDHVEVCGGRPLTKTAQTRMAGNSVSPPPATALLRANLAESMLQREAA